MERKLDRRDFIKAAPAAASVLALTTRGSVDAPAFEQTPTYPEIGSAAYMAGADYLIRPKRFAEVSLADSFWKPKIDTNARVSIPFEANRSGMRGGGLSGNVLEAAIYSLQTHPDSALQSQVDARTRELAQGRPEREGNVPSNGAFEVAVA